MRTLAKHIGNQGKSLIHVAKTQLNMTDDDYRALLQRVAGVTSSRDLDDKGLTAVMAEFKRLGFVFTKSQRKPKSAGGTGPNSPTAAQWRLIEGRARQVGYSGLADPRFIAWMKPRGKVDHPRFLDRDGAHRVIAALGNWIERKPSN
jgi:hypothetical protein